MAKLKIKPKKKGLRVKPKPKPKTSRSGITELALTLKAFDLRMQGLSFNKIAVEMGISESYAYRLISSELNRMNQELKISVDQFRSLELERLEDLWQKAFAKVAEDISNVWVCLKIMDRKSKLLGLDKPSQQAESKDECMLVLPDRLAGMMND